MFSAQDVNTHYFHLISDGLAATPHARRMAGVLLSLFPATEKPEKIACACASQEFAEALLWPGDNILCELLRRNHLPASDVQAMAKRVLKTQDTRDLPGLMALGSPLAGDLTSQLPFPLDSIVMGEPEFHSIARNALWGNPLVHKSSLAPSVSAFGMEVFLGNSALFGDLNNPVITKYLKDHLGVFGKTKNIEARRNALLVQSSLLLRDDLTDDIAIALDDSNFHTPETYRTLVGHQTHRKLVKSQQVEPSQLFPRLLNESEFVFSPEATSTHVFQAYNAAPAQSLRQNSVFLAAQCAKPLYVKALINGNPFLDSDAFVRHSPFAVERLLIPPKDKENIWMDTLRCVFQAQREGKSDSKFDTYK